MPSYRKSAQVDMTHGSVLGRAALFALPICAGNILQLLYSTVDTLVIGNFCDTTALASVATSSQPLEILLCVFVGIGSASPSSYRRRSAAPTMTSCKSSCAPRSGCCLQHRCR